MHRVDELSELDSFQSIGRRAALKQGLAAAAGVVLTSACGRSASALHAVPPRRAFAKVRVAADRVIRTVTGLRPFLGRWFYFGCGNGALIRNVKANGRWNIFGYDTGSWAVRAREPISPWSSWLP